MCIFRGNVTKIRIPCGFVSITQHSQLPTVGVGACMGFSTQRHSLEGPVWSSSVRCFCRIVSSTPLVTTQRVTKLRVCVGECVSKGLSEYVCVCRNGGVHL